MRRLVIQAVVAVVAFVYGIAVMKAHVFPYPVLQAVDDYLFPPGPPPQTQKWYGFRTGIFKEFPVKADVLMVGDSLTEVAPWTAMFPDIKIGNQGIGWGTTRQLKQRLDLVEAEQPKKVFLLVGINDVLQGVPLDETIANYSQSVETIATYAKVYVQSTMLTTEPRLNEEVSKINEQLSAYCQSSGKCTFINLNVALAPNGMLEPEFAYDTLHPNALGYKAWQGAIRSYVEN